MELVVLGILLMIGLLPIVLFFRGEDSPPISPQESPSLSNPSTLIVGKLSHKRIYVFGVSQWGQSDTKCPLCSEPRQHVFSNAVDSNGVRHRCCLRCLRRFGGAEEVERAARRSMFARRVVDCMGALDQLRTEFPDPDRRPYGEKSLMAEIALPFWGYQGIERVIDKIATRKWTSYDLARIEGRPEPEREPSRDEEPAPPNNDPGATRDLSRM